MPDLAAVSAAGVARPAVHEGPRSLSIAPAIQRRSAVLRPMKVRDSRARGGYTEAQHEASAHDTLSCCF